VAEELARDRVKQLFAADHANVQAHSGASANVAAYLAVSKPGDVLLGMSLAHGGHLTHGHPVSYTGQLWRSVQYGVRPEDGRIDYEQVEALAPSTGHASSWPAPAPIRASSTSRASRPSLARWARRCRGHGAHRRLVATGLHPSPVPHAGWCQHHAQDARGPRGGFVLRQAELAEALDKSTFPGLQGGPLMHVIASKAVCFGESLTPAFKEYQKRVVENARILAEGLLAHGFDSSREAPTTTSCWWTCGAGA